MKKYVGVGSVAFAFFLGVLGLQVAQRPLPARADGPNGFCSQAYNSSYTTADQYTSQCPSPSPVPVYNGTLGYSATSVTESVGWNQHLNYGEYSNYAYLQQILGYAKIKHVRDGIEPLRSVSGEAAAYNTLYAALGVRPDLIADRTSTSSTLTSALNLLNTGVAESLEGINELDTCCGEPSWVVLDQNMIKQVISPLVKTSYPSLKIIGPSTGFADMKPLGNLSPWVDFGNTHDYVGGFFPETTGYGGVGYGGYGYGSVLYNISNSKQAAVERPIVPTEFGYQVGPYQRNRVDESTQGTYDLRQILQHLSVGVPRMYIYELLDSGGQNYGLLRGDGSQRPAYQVISGFMNVVSDPGTFSGQCVVPMKVNTNGVRAIGICKSTGEYDLVLWQPANTRDPNALTINTINPINTTITLNSGFTPSSVSAWTYAASTGQWTNAPGVNPVSISVTDRPQVVVFNGASAPTPLPAPPTAPPTPIPAPTPTYIPTPTPAPTVTPTSIAIKQSTQAVTNDNVNVPHTFASNVTYGDYILSGWSFPQFNASRYVVLGPSFMSRQAPGGNSQPNLPVPVACSPQGDFQGYGETCLDVWGGYVNEQAGYGKTLNWVASAGNPNGSMSYDLTGADASAPIALSATASLTIYNTATCPGVTAPRKGSMAFCYIAAKDGTGFGPGNQLPSNYTNNGWIFDGNAFPPEGAVYYFHYPATTTVNQAIPSINVQISGGGAFLDYAAANTIVVQPPAGA